MKKQTFILLITFTSFISLASGQDIVEDVISPFFKDAQISMIEEHGDHPIIGVRNSELNINILNAHNRDEVPEAYLYGDNENNAFADPKFDRKSWKEVLKNFSEVNKRKASYVLKNLVQKINKFKRRNEPKVGKALPVIMETKLSSALVKTNLDKFVAIAPFTPSQIIIYIANNKKDNKVTWVELELLASYPEIAKKVFPIALYARKIVSKYFEGSPMYFGDADAFRHSFWNAMMVKYINQDYARIEATAREIWEHEDKFDRNDPDQTMDMYNNNIGREIGAKYAHLSDDDIALILIKEIKKGNLFMLKDGKRGNPLVKSKLYTIDLIY